ncbi:MAG: TolC family protein [Daejeonella sp.]|nr:TolC family protein [Daejeonella sp.]
MKNTKTIIVLATLLLLISKVRAQDKLTLPEILQQIETQNPELKVSEATIRSMDEAAKGAKNWMPPQLGTGLFMAPYNPKLWKRMADGTTGMGQYMISAEQMIPNKSMQNAEAAYLSVESSVERERKNSTLNELYATAKSNYFDWLILQKKSKILDQNEKLLQFMIQSAEIRYKNGLGKLNAYYKTKASLGIIQKIRLEIENDLFQKRIRLNTLMNRNQFQNLDIDTSYVLKDISDNVIDSAVLSISRSDIKAIDQEIKLAALQQSVERSKLKPEFGVRYDHMFGFGGTPMQYTLMGMVRIPVRWSTRTQKANIESLKWKSESLSQQKQTLLNKANGEASGILSQILMKKKQLKLYETNILPALRKNFQTTQIAYEQNTEELSVLNEAWETLNMTQLEYLDQVGQLFNLQVSLDRILERK